uniref:Uncharacterized protein n=1 Tax=Cacopsylla melanoneura TaxID=428564 RepID=A0A8D9AB43_9HEMI
MLILWKKLVKTLQIHNQKEEKQIKLLLKYLTIFLPVEKQRPVLGDNWNMWTICLQLTNSIQDQMKLVVVLEFYQLVRAVIVMDFQKLDLRRQKKHCGDEEWSLLYHRVMNATVLIVNHLLRQ